MIALDDLTVYLAIRLPDDAADRLGDIQDMIVDAARHTTATGQQVRYLDGMYIPARNCLLCAFVAESRAAVHAVAERARLPFVQIEPGP
jgi:hypothetical protein